WRGRTPLTLDNLAFGSYIVRVVQPGYKPGRDEFTLNTRTPSHTVTARLERASAPAPAPPTAAPAAPVAFTGSLYVDSRPRGATGGEVVFNTSMTGYQEILTDPSYAGQIVTMTAPEMGNYGVAPDDGESRAPTVAGFIVREESPIASNWRADGTLRDYLTRHNIVAVSGIDTRALTRVLRSAGVMRGIIA